MSRYSPFSDLDRPGWRVPPEIGTARDRVRSRRQRRNRAAALALLVTSAALVALDVSRADETERNTAYAGGLAPPGYVAAAPTPSPAEVSVAQRGPASFAYAGGRGDIGGTAGAVQRYRVAVENGIGVAPEAFAAAVDAILRDPRGWTADGRLQLRRVPGGEAASFTVYLATPVTSEQMCREEWLETEQYTNCRLSDGRVVINLARWLTGVPDYGAPVEVYQEYVINHEVGHQLGWGHELCPGPGQLAPVMQQQTLGLAGCLANGWPYVAGARYRGPAAGQ